MKLMLTAWTLAQEGRSTSSGGEVAGLFIVLVGLAIFAFPFWGIIDSALKPDSHWRAADQNKIAWMLVQMVIPLLGTFIYVVAIRPGVKAGGRSAPQSAGADAEPALWSRDFAQGGASTRFSREVTRLGQRADSAEDEGAMTKLTTLAEEYGIVIEHHETWSEIAAAINSARRGRPSAES